MIADLEQQHLGEAAFKTNAVYLAAIMKCLERHARRISKKIQSADQARGMAEAEVHLQKFIAMLGEKLILDLLKHVNAGGKLESFLSGDGGSP